MTQRYTNSSKQCGKPTTWDHGAAGIKFPGKGEISGGKRLCKTTIGKIALRIRSSSSGNFKHREQSVKKFTGGRGTIRSQKFMNHEHWTILQEEWETEAAIAKSKAASESRKSNPDGKGMHKHCAGP